MLTTSKLTCYGICVVLEQAAAAAWVGACEELPQKKEDIRVEKSVERLDAQGQLRVQLSGKTPGQLHHELADHHHQARQTFPGIGGCVVAAQTHFRSPSLLPSIISSHIHTHF